MYEVRYAENGEQKKSPRIEDREEAFLWQAGLIARRKRKPDGGWDVEIGGVWKV